MRLPLVQNLPSRGITTLLRTSELERGLLRAGMTFTGVGKPCKSVKDKAEIFGNRERGTGVRGGAQQLLGCKTFHT
jgi:hypothetical protein